MKNNKWGELSHGEKRRGEKCLMGRNVIWGEMLWGEMSWGEMLRGELSFGVKCYRALEKAIFAYLFILLLEDLPKNFPYF